VASTEFNLMSSRSHTVFRMIIESNLIKDPSEKKPVRVSALTLIDLAGSEKVVSENSLRRREGAYINKSLLTLGTVISKLSERKKGEPIGHLPYRDSKLTRILEPSLSGNSRIAVIGTLTPGSDSIEETISTLKFASRAKKITNKPAVNEDNESTQIVRFKKEIEDLKKKLEVAQEAEEKLHDLETELNNKGEHEEELRQQLQDQESLRASLEEKIKQLTKLILVSTSVDTSKKRMRSTTASFSLTELDANQRSKVKSPLLPAMDLSETPALLKIQELTLESQEDDEDWEEKARSVAKVNKALAIKIDILQQAAERKDKQIVKLKDDLTERDLKIEEILNLKVNESNNDDLKSLQQLLKEHYTK